MTSRLYDDYPYETSFTASVTECRKRADENYDIILDRTLFFPEEGGQSPDTGILKFADSEVSITDVQIDKDGIIRHTCSCPVPEGITVCGQIDWGHRFSNMQQHTGEHIFSGIVNRRFGFDNVGFHLSDNEMTVDYNGPLTNEDLLSIERKANEAVIRNIPVICRYPSADELALLDYRSKKEIEGAVRIVSIEGIDTCACCAPHVRSTGEVGLIKVIDHQSHRGGTRIWILCGFRAINEFSMLQEACSVVSREYSAPVSPAAFENAILKRNDQIAGLKERISSLQGELLALKVGQLDPEDTDVILFVNGMDEVQKRNVLNELVKTHTGFCSAFDGNDTDGYSFIIASSERDCREAFNTLKERFGARGGGHGIMVQGSVRAASEDIRSVMSGL